MNHDEKTAIAAALVHAADILLDSDKSRANKILLKAIGLAKNPMAKGWLRDGRASGTWIRTAADLLERSAAKAAELGLTEDQVDEEVATMMAWMALSTILRDAKRGSGLLAAVASERNKVDAGRLPVVKIDGKDYYADGRLKEVRNVHNPHDRMTYQEVMDGVDDEAIEMSDDDIGVVGKDFF